MREKKDRTVRPQQEVHDFYVEASCVPAGEKGKDGCLELLSLSL